VNSSANASSEEKAWTTCNFH
jgi:hypothetical protein